MSFLSFARPGARKATGRRSAAALVLLAAVAGFALPQPARAATVDFSSSGTFGVTSPTVYQFTANSNTELHLLAPAGLFDLSYDEAVVTYAGLSKSVNANPTVGPVQIGTFTVANTHNADVFGFPDNPDLPNGGSASGSFTLVINQTVPGVGSQSFSATLSGHIDFDHDSTGDHLTITFSKVTDTIGGVTYTISPNPITLNSPDDHDPTTTTAFLFATVTATTTNPEPTSLAMLCMGAFGIAGYARRKRKPVAA